MQLHKLPTAILASVIAVAFAVAPVAADNSGGHGHKARSKVEKLDKKLRETLRRAPQPTRVIIRTKDGQQRALLNALTAHGDVVESQHHEIGALTAVVHGEDLLAIANDPSVESVSIDADVFPFLAGSAAGASQRFAASKANGRAAGHAKKDPGASSEAKAPKGSSKSTLAPSRSQRAHSPRWGAEARAEFIGRARRIQGLGRDMPTGRRVGVAVIDSGIELSEDFYGTVTAFYDFTQGEYPLATAPYDDYGHGTFIASLIANQGRQNAKFQGVAPGVHLVGLKVLDSKGAGKTSDVIRAIAFAIQYRHLLDIDVLNLSLGHPVFESAASDPLVGAVEAAHRAGLVVVVSAGNFGMNPETRQVGYGGMQVGYGGITSPGNAPSAITVGAADTRGTVRRSDDRVAPFSSRGPSWIDGFAKPDLVAPGVGEVAKAAHGAYLFQQYPGFIIRSVDDDEGFERDDRGGFAKLSGTSMAAAEVSGVVALVLEANPRLTANTVNAVLEYSATPLVDDNGQLYDALTQGAGEVNGAGAIEVARAIDTSAPLGSPWLGPHEPSTMFDQELHVWSQNIVWGNYWVRGVDSLFFRSNAWDDNIVWGSLGRVDDDNIVWGSFARDEDDNIVWGNLAVWGSLYDRDQPDNIVWGTFSRDGEGDDNIVWGTFVRDDDNIVWGTVYRDGDDNIVWGNNFDWDDNIVWGNSLLGYRDGDDNIVWGNLSDWDGDGDNIVWGNLADDNIVWGNFLGRGDDDDDDENIVWGNTSDSVVWGTSVLLYGRF